MNILDKKYTKAIIDDHHNFYKRKSYCRKPKNWLERIWFMMRPQIIRAERNREIWVIWENNHHFYILHDKFKANYEPVDES